MVTDTDRFWSVVRVEQIDDDHVHARAVTSELFDRWLQVFHDTVDGGWVGPKATMVNKRATGMAWAMAQRFLGHGIWRPADRR